MTLKEFILSIDLSLPGNSFHNRGAAARKAPPP